MLCGNCRAWKHREDDSGECWSRDSMGDEELSEPVRYTIKSQTCEAWEPSERIPPWRQFGELRKPVDRKFLRYCAVRSVYEAKMIDLDQACRLLEQRHTKSEMVVVLAAIDATWSKSYKPSRIIQALTPSHESQFEMALSIIPHHGEKP